MAQKRVVVPRRLARSALGRLLLAVPLLLGSIAALTLFMGPNVADGPPIRAKRHAIFEGSIRQGLPPRRFAFLGLQCRNASSREESQQTADQSQFPEDLFSLEQRQRGAVFLHLFGLVYLFIALAIVCDEFFVPSLAVITERLDISDDVAGATFMAAGGSAPEFFTSVVGTFVAQNNVGIGTIVGSATFNILCVLAFCTLFSCKELELSWWPLFRDVSFYIISLMILVVAFLDEQIIWWEALALFGVYLAYALFMKFNASIELCVKTHFGCQLGDEEEEDGSCQPEEETEVAALTDQSQMETSQAEMPANNSGTEQQQHQQQTASQQPEWTRKGHRGLHRSDTVSAHRTLQPNGSLRRRQSSIPGSGGSRRQSIPILHSGAMFRNGIISLMSQTLDPLSEGTDAGEADAEMGHQPSSRRSSRKCMSLQQNGGALIEPILKKRDQNGNMQPGSGKKPGGALESSRSPRVDFEEIKSVLEEEGGDKPLDMGWPVSSRWHKQLLYVFLFPILFPLWLTMADVRRLEKRKYFPLTFLLSILWIAFFSYLMVWLANTIGLTLGIPTEVLGLTILAAGTSIPDLITSVIVARKGLGDMAVSSSVGSNIFDVCVGLPIPWLLFFLWQLLGSASPAQSVPVSSNGLVCSVGMLFLMLLLLLSAVAACGWRMNKTFGIIMIFAYLAFCALSIALEVGRLACPLRLC